MNLFTKQTQRRNLWLPEERMEVGRDRLGVSDGHVLTTVFKTITNKDLLYCTGNSTQYSVIT